jgi:hypothetical protein
MLKSTIPNFVKEDYPNFVVFLQAYYEWMYSSNNPFYAPLISENFKDIDKTPDFFLKYFRKQYLVDFPESLTLDKQSGTPLDIKTLIKNVVDFYSSKGTEKSIKFLIKILYDSYSEIYHPKRDIFKASSSKWNKRKSIKFSYSANNIHEIQNKKIYQDSGETIISVATIEEIQTYRGLDNKQIVEVFFTNVKGIFDFTKPFKVDVDNGIIILSPLVLVDKLDILDGGLNYKVNDKITIKRLTVLSGLLEIISYARVSEVNKFGAITKIEFVSFGVSYNPKELNSDGIFVDANNFLYFAEVESEVGDDAMFNVDDGGFIAEYAGSWSKKNSHTDTIKKIADNKRYQEFSYVVRTDRMLDRYGDVLKKLAHPAGIELLGDILVLDIADITPEINDSFVEVYTPLIGNYAPYRIFTDMNIRNIMESTDADLFPHGFDPSQPNPLQDGAPEFVHVPVSPLDEDVHTTKFKHTPLVSDVAQKNNYWVVYPHPNTEINNTTDITPFKDITLKDFLKQEN